MYHLIKENHVPLVKAILSVIATQKPRSESAQIMPYLTLSSLNVSEAHAQFVIAQLAALGFINDKKRHWSLTFEGKDMLNKIAPPLNEGVKIVSMH